MKKNNPKPIEYDAHFKYLCPNSSCCYPHWLSLKEASTEGFKIACDCGAVFSVKQIEKIKIKYCDGVEKKRDVFAEREQQQIVEEKSQPSENTFIKAKNLLLHYGFSANEADEMISKTMAENPHTDDYVFLVKHSLFSVKND